MEPCSTLFVQGGAEEDRRCSAGCRSLEAMCLNSSEWCGCAGGLSRTEARARDGGSRRGTSDCGTSESAVVPADVAVGALVIVEVGVIQSGGMQEVKGAGLASKDMLKDISR